MRLRRGDDRRGISANEFIARRKHASDDQVESGAGDETGDDAAGGDLRIEYGVRMT